MTQQLNGKTLCVDSGRRDEILDAFLQDIDTHLRATPAPLPYIEATMRKYWAYKEVTPNDRS
ncbi:MULTISPECIES: hypothetical protein [Heyndrickxia]|uniref:hypothetical protein n=1 Tax=Heyndrickxia TaxID=2837504 RepID=UPI002E23C463|nr:hypothetical protein [Weizmannia sp. CD-2023]